MPPKKSVKNDKEVKEQKLSEVKEIKDKKETKEVKNKKDYKDSKDNKKWAEVTDDEYHDDNDIDEDNEGKSEDSNNSEDEEEFEEELLLETLKSVVKNQGFQGNNQTKSKSIVDFDYDEIYMMDLDELADYDTNTLLKVLMVRGTKTNNPILWSKCKTLLKLLNFELKPNQPYRGRNNYRRDDRRDNRKDNNYNKKNFDNKYNKNDYIPPVQKPEKEEVNNDKEVINTTDAKKKSWRGGKK